MNICHQGRRAPRIYGVPLSMSAKRQITTEECIHIVNDRIEEWRIELHMDF